MSSFDKLTIFFPVGKKYEELFGRGRVYLGGPITTDLKACLPTSSEGPVFPVLTAQKQLGKGSYKMRFEDIGAGEGSRP